MPQPVVSALAQRMYDYLKPYQRIQGISDETMGWPLLRWCSGWAEPLENVYAVVKTRNGKEGWSALTDPDQAIPLTMPFLAQLIGTRLVQGETPEQWRDEIKDSAGLYAGSPASVAGAIQKSGALKIATPRTVLILGRDTGSAYHHLIGVFENDLNNYVADGGFESGIDGWVPTPDGSTAPFLDGDNYVTLTRKSLNVHTGHWALEIAIGFDTSGAMKTIPGTFKKGDQVTIKFWIYYVDNINLKIRVREQHNSVTDLYSNDGVLLTDGGGWAQVQVVKTFTLTKDVTDPKLMMTASAGLPPTIWIDDFSFQVDNGQYEAFVTAALRQKPIGHKFDLTVIEAGNDWTYFTIGATRWQRDEAGYMVEIPPPYPTYDDIEDAFRNLDFFSANRLEWLNYNNDFQFGDDTNWNYGGGATVATTQALDDPSWQRSPGYAYRVTASGVTSGSTYQDQGSLDSMELVPGKQYRMTILRKILAATGANPRLYFAIDFYDSGFTLVDRKTVGSAAATVGVHDDSLVFTVPDDIDIVTAEPYITWSSSGGGSIDGYIDEVSIKFEPED